MNSLDNILSGGGEPAPAPEKQDTTPAASEQPAEQTTEQTSETTEGEQQTGEPGKPVPFGAIRRGAEEKVNKRYSEHVADQARETAELRREIAEMRRERAEERAAPKAPPPPPQPPPDIFENPNAAIQYTMEPELKKVHQYIEELREAQRQAEIRNSHFMAASRHTREVVQAADAAFTQAFQSGRIHPADVERVLKAPNIYDAAVEWEKEQQKRAPDYEERLREKHWAEFQQEQHNGQPNGNGGYRPVMPSNLNGARNVGTRNGPTWAGPTSLNDIFNRRK